MIRSVVGSRMVQAAVAAAFIFAVLSVTNAGAQTCPSLAGYEDFGLKNQGPSAVAISGHYAFTADTYGLSVYDISVMDNPVRVAQLLLPAAGMDIVVSGTTAFVAGWDERLHVVDLTEARHPSVVASVDLPGPAYDLALGSGMIYIAYYNADDLGSGTAGLQIVDVSSPSHPELRGRIAPPTDLLYLSNLVLGPSGVLYSGDWFSQLQVFDVSDADHPVLLGSHSFGDTALDISGDYLYVSSNPFLSVVDLSDPANPKLVRQVDGVGVREAVVQGEMLYASGKGFQVFDLSDPTTPFLVSSVDSPAPNRGRLSVSGGVAVVVDDDQLLHFVDIADPTDPRETASLNLEGAADRVVASGNLVFVGNGKTLQVLDVTDAEAPVQRGTFEASDSIGEIDVSGNTAYLIVGWRLEIVDVSDPDHLTWLGTYKPARFAWSLAVAGSRAYLALGSHHGFEVVDVADPESPALLDTGVWGASRLWASGSILYVLTRDSGLDWLEAFDVSDPANPVERARSSYLDDEAWDAGFAGSSLIVASGSGGVEIFDAGNLKRIGRAPTPGFATAVEVFANMAVVSCWDGGVAFVDIADPTNPVVVGSLQTRRAVRDAAVAPANSTGWTASGALVEGVRADCPTCAGLAVSVADDVIPAGGASTRVTVGVGDLTGKPAPGQQVAGWATAGALGAFTDHGDGTYTATYTSGPNSGSVQISFQVNGHGCARGAAVRVDPVPCDDCRPARRAGGRARPAAR